VLNQTVCRPGATQQASSQPERDERATLRVGRIWPVSEGRGVDALRVLIVEDHPVFRDGLRALLSSIPGTDVVGEASSGVEAVEQALALQPDVVVMDLDLPELSGLAATRRIVATSPHVGVLVLTMFDDDDSLFAAMRAGARGYLLKGADQDDIRRAILAVGDGDAIFGPAVARRLMEYFSVPRPEVRDAFPELTERERQVLNLIAQGQANVAIATRMGISTKTVRNHVSNIFTKLQVTDRAQAIVRAREAGLGIREEDDR
jgi:DNA-binding NarL/FixJ family response regulator